jgi:hypothetical protein
MSTEILVPLLRIIKSNEGGRKDNKEKPCPVSMYVILRYSPRRQKNNSP